MKKYVTFMFVLMCCVTITFAQNKGKITVQITKEIDGSKKTFKGEYESEEQMRADPEYQKFAGEENDFFFSFDHPGGAGSLDSIHSSFNIFSHGNGATSFWMDDEDSIMKQLGIKLHRFDCDDKDFDALVIELDKLKGHFSDSGTTVSSFARRKLSIEDAGDDFGKRGKVSKKKFLELKELSISSSPFNTRLNITFEIERSADITVKITDEKGKPVMSRYVKGFSGNYNEVFDLTNQEKGNYLLEIEKENKRLTKKIIIR